MQFYSNVPLCLTCAILKRYKFDVQKSFKHLTITMTGQQNKSLDVNQQKMAVHIIILFHLHLYPIDGNLHDTLQSSGAGSA